MNVLIVHAHPEPRSFCSACKNAAAETLTAAGHTVVVSDLHADGFKAVADAEDFSQRRDADRLTYALEQRHNDANGTLAPDIARELERLIACDLLILSFPLYWFSVPAILKGWFDRVLVSGRTYGGKRIYARGGLAGKRALCCVTTGGREDMLTPGGIHGDLTAMLRPVLVGTLGYTGMTVLRPFFAYHVPYVDDAARAAVLDGWRAHVGAVDTLERVAMPALDDFDDRFFRMDSGS